MRHIVMLRSADASAPAVPTGLTATAGTGSNVVLTWDASADPYVAPTGASGLKEYVVSRDGAFLANVATTPGLSLELVGSDIGGFLPPGSDAQGGASHSLTAAGNQIYGTSDQFRFKAAQFTGDCTIYAQVASFESASNGFSKAGLMFRASLSADAAFVHCMSFPFAQGNGVKIEYRPTTAASTTEPGAEVNVAAVPRWLKLTKVGNTFTGYYSTSGGAWTLIGSAVVTLPTTYYVGLAVGSESALNPVTALFQNVAITNSPQATYTDTTASGTPSYKVAARDVAGNTSAESAAAAPASATFRNWPTMYVCWAQGSIGNGASTTAGRIALAKCDIAITQNGGLGNRAAEYANALAIKAIRPAVVTGPYLDACLWYASSETDTFQAQRWVYDAAIQGPNTAIGGGNKWRLRDASGTGLTHRFDVNNSRIVNMASTVAGTNGAGLRMSQVQANVFYDTMTDANGNRFAISGVLAFDDMTCVDYPRYPGGADATPDYDQDGVGDTTTNNATGGVKYRTGQVQHAADFRAKFPGYGIFWNNDLALPYLNTPAPPLPVSSIEIAGVPDATLAENIMTYRFRIGNHETQSTSHLYPLGSGVASYEGWVALAVNEAVSRSDSASIFGKKMYALYQNMALSSAQSMLPSDIAYARMMLGIALSVEGCAYAGITSDSNRPVWVDELALKLGAPLAARSMGTLNQASAPVTFTLRAADFVGAGGAQFFFTQFENGLVVLRWDTIGLTGGVSNHGDGSPASYTLPAGTWRRPNAATYVHPDHSDLAMVGQDTALNNGATGVTSSSLKPLHAEFFLRG